jgi:hypothetical protein
MASHRKHALPGLKRLSFALVLAAGAAGPLAAKHPLPGPHTFLCESIGSPDESAVRLSWDTLGIGDGSLHKAAIYRDGALLVELAPDALEHVDREAPPGHRSYRLDILASGQSDSIATKECSVEVPGLACEVFGGVAVPPQVLLAWPPAPPETLEIIVERDGDPIARLDAGATTHAEEPLSGTHEYRVFAVIDDPAGGGPRRMLLGACTVEFEPPVIGGFQRGDCTGDGAQNISDAICILDFLFGGGDVGCGEAADADDGGRVDLTDAIFLLNHLFIGGPALPAPFPGCGHDPTEDGLTCDVHAPCFTPPPP